MSAAGGRGGQVRALLELSRRNADFRRLLVSSVVSFIGDWFALVAVSGLVKELTGREGSTAFVFAAQVLPIFLMSPIAGVLADRVDRKRMLIVSDLARVVPALGLVVAAVSGTAWVAYLCVALISAMAAFFEPIVSAVVPNVVDEDDLPLAQTGIGSVWGSMLFVGAALGGLAAATLGRETSFVLNAATFVVSAVLVARITVPLNRGEVTANASVFANLGELWRFVRPRKTTRAFLITKAGVGLGNGVVGLLPIYAIDRFGTGDAGVGILLAARGLGALVGPYFGRALHRDQGNRLVLVCGASIVAYGIAYAFLPVSDSLWVAAVLVTLAHAGGGNQWVSSTTGLQMTTPDAVRGRVMSLDFGLATLAMGISSIGAGVAAEVVGLDATSWVMAAVAVAYGLWWLAWTRDLWRGDTDPLQRDATGARKSTAVPGVGLSGDHPVV